MRLVAVAKSVKMVRFSELLKGGDVSDFVDAGGTREKLLDRAAAAEPLTELAVAKMIAEEKLGQLSIGDIEAELGAIDWSAPTNDVLRTLDEVSKLLPPMTALERSLMRERSIKLLCERGVKAPAKLVDALLGSAPRDEKDELSGRPVVFEELEPWSNGAVDPHELLGEVFTFFERYLFLPVHGALTLALWTLLTYVFDNFDVCPYLCVTLPLPGCGKSLTLDALSAVVYRPLRTASITPAAIFRSIEAHQPALLIDEADTFLDNDELRGVVNSGHARAGAFVLRMVPHGEDYATRAFTTWCPKAIALIGRPVRSRVAR